MSTPAATMRVEPSSVGGLTLVLAGRLDFDASGALWRRIAEVTRAPADLVVDLAGVTYCDMSGVGLLVGLRRRTEEAGRSLRIENASEETLRLLALFKEGPPTPAAGAGKRPGLLEQVGRSAWAVWTDFRDMVVFLGKITESFWLILLHRQRVRWKDTFMVAESAGLNALPIISLMGIIVGLIIAFQGAVPLKRYGGEILVADMVVIAMFREIGPLFTAIMLAARSSSAFAAELGTMKVNEEVDALTTMGLDPVVFLAVPRVTAGILVTPLLTIFMNLCGLFGGGVVFLILGFPALTYINRIEIGGSAMDFTSGLIRSVVFGIIVAGVGCLSGLQTGKGARAVGESTTRSVVSTIVLVIIADGLFAVVFNALNL